MVNDIEKASGCVFYGFSSRRVTCETSNNVRRLEHGHLGNKFDPYALSFPKIHSSNSEIIPSEECS